MLCFYFRFPEKLRILLGSYRLLSLAIKMAFACSAGLNWYSVLITKLTSDLNKFDQTYKFLLDTSFQIVRSLKFGCMK